MYFCIYVYMCICVYVCMFTCINAFMSICIVVYMFFLLKYYSVWCLVLGNTLQFFVLLVKHIHVGLAYNLYQHTFHTQGYVLVFCDDKTQPNLEADRDILQSA